MADRSGKSSISSVVFHKVPPSETLFLESTVRIQKDSMAYVAGTCPCQALSDTDGYSPDRLWISKYGIFLGK